jgi:hypothetical protein
MTSPITMNLNEIGFEDVNWIHKAQNIVTCWVGTSDENNGF